MATQTRFDLKAAVENWRNELAAQLELSPDDRRELEKHLADSMAELRDRGLNEEESFWLARRRMGQPQQLAEEYFKTNPGEVWRGRMFWMLFGNFAAFVWGFLTNAAAIKFYAGKADAPWWVDNVISIISAILPLIIGVLLVKGKLLRQASALDWILKSRSRFVVTAFVLSGLASATLALSMVGMAKSFVFVLAWLMTWLTNVIFIGIIVYFMPKRERNISKSA